MFIYWQFSIYLAHIVLFVVALSGINHNKQNWKQERLLAAHLSLPATPALVYFVVVFNFITPKTY